MKHLILIASLSLAGNHSAFAGATHRFCGNDQLPDIKVCEDQQGECLYAGSDPVQKFRFLSFGEDRSVAHKITPDGSYKLTTEKWGMIRILQTPHIQGVILECSDEIHHGLCPGR